MEALTMSIQERADILRQLDWPKGISELDALKLARFLVVFQTPKGHTVFRQGDEASYLGIVIQGKLCVQKDDPTPMPHEIALLEKGDVFGEMSIVDGQPRSATIHAVEDSLMLLLPSESFATLLAEFPRINAKILMSLARSMSERLRRTNDWLIEVLQYVAQKQDAKA